MKRSNLVLILALAVLFSVPLTGCENKTQQSDTVQQVGFDLDDTLVYSTPAFKQAFNRDVEPFSRDFWAVVNASDSEHSCVKPKTRTLLEEHRRKGHEIYVVTAREPHGADVAREFVAAEFGIPEEHVFFEPDGKTDRLEQLGIDMYYGDSDSDISQTRRADARAIRVKRSPKSSYDKKYNPGKFDEKVLQNTAKHTCY